MDQQRIQYLLEQQLAGKITPNEAKELIALADSAQQEELLQAMAQQLEQERLGSTPLPREMVVAALAPILSLDKNAPADLDLRTPHQITPGRKWLWLAASVLLVLSTGAYLWLQQSPSPQKPVAVTPQPSSDIAAGHDGAILEVSDGQTLVLDTIKNGLLTGSLVKSDSALILNRAGQSKSIPEYYTLRTPRARQQQLVLSDGSKIWLNAASSVRFPSAFSEKRREIIITGEVYLEIAKDPSRPFIVKANDAEVEVLGTHFNIMAYDNEPTLQTTLVEGSVIMRQGNNKLALKPGQQGWLLPDHSIRLVPDADLEAALAWKNGVQVFKRSSLTVIMRQVERWYNVDVEFDKNIADTVTFTGQIPRGIPLSQMLKIFETKNIHFKIEVEHQKVMVIP